MLPLPSDAAPPVVVRKVIVRPPYVPVLGPSLRMLLYVNFASVALLGATGAYLGAISLLDWAMKPQSYSTTFTVSMFLVHGIIGAILFVPFVVFGIRHFATSRKRPNRAAVRRGIFTFAFGLLVGGTGLALFQFEGLPQLPTGTLSRSAIYWLHVAIPLAAIFAYVGHRKAGPRIKWGVAKWWAAGTALFAGGMVVLHSYSPSRWYAEGPVDGEAYFHPSEARTADGKFIPAESLMSDTYCMRCHPGIYQDHLHSSHRFSSFNNPAYLVSVAETRRVAQERDGSPKASRWCAGCHDPVPLFTGAFDDPNFSMNDHPTAHAGVTCVACHSMTHIHGTSGNGGYTIEAPNHYPFAFSDNAMMRALSDQTIKAKPDVHKKTFLKPFHKSAEFCSTCHKVGLPVELNHYKDFLRGQNHYDSYLLSGASGHGARSFYYPPKAFANCNSCHMPLKESSDFGAKDFDGSGVRKTHNHLFPGANTGLPTLMKFDPKYNHMAEGWDAAIATHEGFLKDKRLRIDLFALKDGATTSHEKLLPLKPELPVLVPGRRYVVEVVVRTLLIGHHFSQGTVDSNEIWVDFKATSGGKEIARNGALSDEAKQDGTVDPWSHFINVHMLDRYGNRVNRRNAQDIFTPLYDHQIPPGAANVMHYRLDVPEGLTAPIELTATLRYRKFDHEYMTIVHDGKAPPKLPIIDICSDKVTLPVRGVRVSVPPQESGIAAEKRWERWNDYGIACLIEGGVGMKKGHFRQAEAAFRKLTTLGVPEAVAQGHTNLARVLIDEGRYNEAAEQLKLAGAAPVPTPWWTRAWLTATVNSENADRGRDGLDAAIGDLERIIAAENQPQERGFDFSKDYVILNMLANRLFKRRLFEVEGSDAERAYVLRAVAAGEAVLKLEAEDVQAHDLLKQCYAYLAGAQPTEVPSNDVPNFADLPKLAADLSANRGNRRATIDRLRRGFDAIGSPAPGGPPRLALLRDVWRTLQPLHQTEQDGETKLALARMMASLHREFHILFKPDEVARSYATRIYRGKNPAANYAARDRVVYPTTAEHRERILQGGELTGD